MAQPYVGEIRMFAGNFAPAGWMFCGGQLLPIAEYETLFQLIGTTYGGDGQSNFGLPDLRGRLPVHMGNGFTLAQTGGVEDSVLTVNQIPVHSHAFIADSRPASTAQPAGATVAEAQADLYTVPGSQGSMNAQSVTPAGGSLPHTNMQPYLCVDFIISLFGIFPSPT